MKGARPYPQVDRKQNNRLMNVFEYSFNPLVHMAPAIATTKEHVKLFFYK